MINGRDGRICYTRFNRLASRPADHFLLAISPNFCITQRNVFTEDRVVLIAFSFLEPKSSIREETVSFSLLDSVLSILHIKLMEGRIVHGKA